MSIPPRQKDETLVEYLKRIQQPEVIKPAPTPETKRAYIKKLKEEAWSNSSERKI